MRYLIYLFGSFAIAATSYFALVFVLFPTPSLQNIGYANFWFLKGK